MRSQHVFRDWNPTSPHVLRSVVASRYKGWPCLCVLWRIKFHAHAGRVSVFVRHPEHGRNNVLWNRCRDLGYALKGALYVRYIWLHTSQKDTQQQERENTGWSESYGLYIYYLRGGSTSGNVTPLYMNAIKLIISSLTLPFRYCDNSTW